MPTLVWIIVIVLIIFLLLVAYTCIRFIVKTVKLNKYSKKQPCSTNTAKSQNYVSKNDLMTEIDKENFKRKFDIDYDYFADNFDGSAEKTNGKIGKMWPIMRKNGVELGTAARSDNGKLYYFPLFEGFFTIEEDMLTFKSQLKNRPTKSFINNSIKSYNDIASIEQFGNQFIIYLEGSTECKYIVIHDNEVISAIKGKRPELVVGEGSASLKLEYEKFREQYGFFPNELNDKFWFGPTKSSQVQLTDGRFASMTIIGSSIVVDASREEKDGNRLYSSELLNEMKKPFPDPKVLASFIATTNDISTIYSDMNTLEFQHTKEPSAFKAALGDAIFGHTYGVATLIDEIENSGTTTEKFFTGGLHVSFTGDKSRLNFTFLAQFYYPGRKECRDPNYLFFCALKDKK